MNSSSLPPGTTTCLIVSEKLRVATNYDLSNGLEKVEEWCRAPSLFPTSSGDEDDFILIVRRWRCKDNMGWDLPWEYEIGEGKEIPNQPLPPPTTLLGAKAPPDVPPTSSNSNPINEIETLSISNRNPSFHKLSNSHSLIYEIQNCPWPKENYSLSLDVTHPTKIFVLRTMNKKYFKKISIPSLLRLSLPLEENALSFTHDLEKMVLTICYKKPIELIDVEKKEREIRRKGLVNMKDGAVDCKQS